MADLAASRLKPQHRSPDHRRRSREPAPRDATRDTPGAKDANTWSSHCVFANCETRNPRRNTIAECPAWTSAGTAPDHQRTRRIVRGPPPSNVSKPPCERRRNGHSVLHPALAAVASTPRQPEHDSSTAFAAPTPATLPGCASSCCRMVVDAFARPAAVNPSTGESDTACAVGWREGNRVPHPAPAVSRETSAAQPDR